MIENGERTDVLGIGVSAINIGDAIDTIEQWVAQRTQQYVCVTGVHGVMESRKDARLQDIHRRAGMVTPDGMPLVWMSRWFGASRTERVYGPDLMRAVSARSPARGLRHFYYGGPPGIADQLASALVAANPGLNVVGTLCPPFRPLTPEEDAEVVAQINAAAPDIIWVGLSTPKQEYWMASHVGLVNASVLIGVGAAFDFLAGMKKQAPAWMQRNGLEWLFRLCTEPRRLWRRYAYIVPRFMILAGAALLRRAVRTRISGAALETGHAFGHSTSGEPALASAYGGQEVGPGEELGNALASIRDSASASQPVMRDEGSFR